MSQVELRPNPPLPRPESLCLPDAAVASSTQAMIRSSSFSPYPSFPGAPDPHGLDQFLLPPDVTSFLYACPAPAQQTSPQVQASSASGTSQSERKSRALSMSHRPSPLSRPPVLPGGDTSPGGLQRRRSNSLDSAISRSSLEARNDEVTPDVEPDKDLDKTSRSLGSRSLRRAFTFTRRSILGVPREAYQSITDLAPPENIALTASSSSIASDDTNPTTPMSSRSNSDYSEVSSASSSTSSSSEGVKTPNDVRAPIDVEIAGGKLAVALAAGIKQGRKVSWRGWLGGRRGSKIYASSTPGSSTPTDLSAESSPNSSTTNLVAILQLTLTPSPAIDTPSVPASVVMPTTEQTINRGFAIEQLRRMSFQKLAQLRPPSPHPLALALKRQYSNLPEEVALSMQSGQKIFPMSVNAHAATPSGLNPAQGGLITSLAIKFVLAKLDNGQCPTEDLPAKRSAEKTIVPRPRGVLDFIHRAPFEERNIVYFPDGVFSPISMARPGYGVWDLDFSPYMLALSTSDDPVGTSASWPKLPRASIGAPIDEFEAVMGSVKDEVSSPGSEETEEVLVSPATTVLPLVGEPKVTVDASEIGEEQVSLPSSFSKARKVVHTWEYSSDEESEGETEEDELPLKHIVHHRSESSLRNLHTMSSSPSSRSPLGVAKVAMARQTIAVESTVGLRKSLEEIKQRLAMDELAKARERRHANAKGEVERLAEADRRRSQSIQAPRSPQKRPSTPRDPSMSMTSRSPRPSAGPRSTSSPRPPNKDTPLPPRGSLAETRRRTRSSYDTLAPPRPETSRQRSAPESGLPTRRFHSFYELPITATAAQTQQPQLQQPPPHHSGFPYPTGAVPYTHPAMVAFPGMPHTPSMMFPNMNMAYHPGGGLNRPTYSLVTRQSGSSLVPPSSSRQPSYRTRIA